MSKVNANGLTEAEFLAQYNPGDYERPSVTVDMIVLRMKKDLSCMQILLIKRKDHPCIDEWALPGGFINMDESAYEAAARELEEETGLKDVYLEQLYTMSQPNRDPRMRIIDISYIALLPYDSDKTVVAGDDAADAKWFDIEFDINMLKIKNDDALIVYTLDEKIFTNGNVKTKNYVPVLASEDALAFDHEYIVLEGLSRLRNKVLYTDVAFGLMPKRFTLPDLQKVYEVILGKPLYKTNFRGKMTDKVTELVVREKSITNNRLSKTYRYNGGI